MTVHDFVERGEEINSGQSRGKRNKNKETCHRSKKNLIGTSCSLQIESLSADSKHIKNNALSIVMVSSLKLLSSAVFIILQQVMKFISVVPWDFERILY